LVEHLAGSLESAMLLEALSAAPDEITRDLAPASVQLHLRGRDPHFVVTSPAAEPLKDADEDDPAMVARGPDGGQSIAEVKAAIGNAAAKEGRSVNACAGPARARLRTSWRYRGRAPSAGQLAPAPAPLS
jgi:hypothetical protein